MAPYCNTCEKPIRVSDVGHVSCQCTTIDDIDIILIDEDIPEQWPHLETLEYCQQEWS